MPKNHIFMPSRSARARPGALFIYVYYLCVVHFYIISAHIIEHAFPLYLGEANRTRSLKKTDGNRQGTLRHEDAERTHAISNTLKENERRTTHVVLCCATGFMRTGTTAFHIWGTSNTQINGSGNSNLLTGAVWLLYPLPYSRAHTRLLV